MCHVVAASENVELQPGCLDAIMKVSAGDMRKAVTYLQTCHQLSGGAPISMEDIVDISGQVGVMMTKFTIANLDIVNI